MSYRWFTGVLLSLFVVAGCTGAAGQARRDAGRSTAIAVSTAPVQHISIQRTVDLAGTLISPDQAKVSAEAAGVVQSVSVALGDNVTRGQELVRLAPRELELALERAQSALRQTEAQLGMAGEDSAPVPDDQIAAIRTANANLEDART